jgi:hypothetical protein
MLSIIPRKNLLLASAVTAGCDENRVGMAIMAIMPEYITAYSSNDVNPLINAGIRYAIAETRP